MYIDIWMRPRGARRAGVDETRNLASSLETAHEAGESGACLLLDCAFVRAIIALITPLASPSVPGRAKWQL